MPATAAVGISWARSNPTAISILDWPFKNSYDPSMNRPREFDEAEIVARAMGVFWRKGFESTSVADLEDATGLQRGSLYGAFGNKHGLFLEALDLYTKSVLGGMRSRIHSADDPLEALRAFVRCGGEDCKQEPSRSRGCMVGNSFQELAACDEVARGRLDAFRKDLTHIMAEGIRRAQSTGRFPKARDPDAVATALQCGMQGLALLAKSGPPPSVIDGAVHEILRLLDP
jgi:AcrR family transcriptional regulator